MKQVGMNKVAWGSLSAFGEFMFLLSLEKQS